MKYHRNKYSTILTYTIFKYFLKYIANDSNTVKTCWRKSTMIERVSNYEMF